MASDPIVGAHAEMLWQAGEVQRLRTALAEAVALLREVDDRMGTGDVCPFCGVYRLVRRDRPGSGLHRADCRLAAVLARHGEGA